MKKSLLHHLLFYFFILSLSSCTLFGIHTQVHNPRHKGKYPKFSASVKLLGEQSTRFRTCFDVTYYDLKISVDDQNKSLKGSVKIYATAKSDLDTIQIDLFKNMKVLSILSSEGKQLGYTRKYGAIFIVLKEKAGQKFAFTVEYEGKPVVAPKPPWQGGFVWKKDKEGNPWIGVACETEGASLWWPCKDVTNDEPDSMSISITTRKDLTGVANGHFKGKAENENSATYQWFVSYPINHYNVSIYIGKFKLLSDTHVMPSGKTLDINHYVLPPNYEKAKTHLSQAKEQLSFFEKTFGEYPWYLDGYKLIESPYEGMEHQTAIAYGAGYKIDNNGFDYIILHETAHEWWGNSITASDLSDVWLQEGFATYSEALYVEKKQGFNAYLRYLLTYRLFIKNKRPVVGPSGARYFDYKDSDVYMKGAWILHTLRTLIGDDKIFFDIIRSFHEKYTKQTVTSAEFKRTVNEKTGDDYTWFFDQYLYKREAPFLEHYWDGENFYYRWKYVAPAFKMPAEIALDDVRINLRPTCEIQQLAVSSKIYKAINFNTFWTLFGTEESKKLKREVRKMKRSAT